MADFSIRQLLLCAAEIPGYLCQFYNNALQHLPVLCEAQNGRINDIHGYKTKAKITIDAYYLCLLCLFFFYVLKMLCVHK